MQSIRFRGYGTTESTACSTASPVKKSLSPTEPHTWHDVSPTDSMQGLALKYNTTAEKLRKMNRIGRNEELFLRKKMAIPCQQHSTPLAISPKVNRQLEQSMSYQNPEIASIEQKSTPMKSMSSIAIIQTPTQAGVSVHLLYLVEAGPSWRSQRLSHVAVTTHPITASSYSVHVSPLFTFLEAATTADKMRGKDEWNSSWGNESRSIDDTHTEAVALALRHGLMEDQEILKKGAVLHYFPRRTEALGDLSEEDLERVHCELEGRKRWSQPASLYWMVILAALSAFSMGMDETVVNGAQLFFLKELGIADDAKITGLVVAAPYLSASLLGCWLSVPVNNLLGRRSAVCLSMLINIVASIWQAFSPSWEILLGARLLLGLAIGVVSSTVTVWTAECTPVYIRGGLVMLWQTFVALGIMIGYAACAGFVHAKDNSLSWRLMLGSTCVVPTIVVIFIFTAPESPRWLIKTRKTRAAFHVLIRLRGSSLLAARDLFAITDALDKESQLKKDKYVIVEMLRDSRSRRAAVASFSLMFLQQACGINIIMYFSSEIFVQSGVSTHTALYASLGAGVLNFLFSFPAIPLIDRLGRRTLVLWTFPVMGIFLFLTSLSLLLQDSDTRVALVATCIFLFVIAYSPGEGPVPMTYAGECYPMHIRSIGMSSSASVCWFFSFILSFTFPSLLQAFKIPGAFGFYAAWCFIGWAMIFFLVPETAGLSLEQLDLLFGVSTREHIIYQMNLLKWRLQYWRGKADEESMPELKLWGKTRRRKDPSEDSSLSLEEDPTNTQF
ncbi:putative MFS sugar transporter [Planoprotostelium fungivorum]|uniref:Putative MFS sugar transporter n=1 Tax=Planoprotostelium fungivorum TaxID=1890364 RepID=A0A2P6N3G6_9EUKA|nr:putative MFS sugar transporter [Planoprotostelium fungivorum]